MKNTETAASLILEFQASLYTAAPSRQVAEEWTRALARVVDAVRAECIREELAPRGDATDSIRAALTECIGRMPPDEAVASFVDELSRRGFYVVDRARFDATRRVGQ